jgi:hypothetical protein
MKTTSKDRGDDARRAIMRTGLTSLGALAAGLLVSSPKEAKATSCDDSGSDGTLTVTRKGPIGAQYLSWTLVFDDGGCERTIWFDTSNLSGLSTFSNLALNAWELACW